jgi:hypothetical protein
MSFWSGNRRKRGFINLSPESESVCVKLYPKAGSNLICGAAWCFSSAHIQLLALLLNPCLRSLSFWYQPQLSILSLLWSVIFLGTSANGVILLDFQGLVALE